MSNLSPECIVLQASELGYRFTLVLYGLAAVSLLATAMNDVLYLCLHLWIYQSGSTLTKNTNSLGGSAFSMLIEKGAFMNVSRHRCLVLRALTRIGKNRDAQRTEKECLFIRPRGTCLYLFADDYDNAGEPKQIEWVGLQWVSPLWVVLKFETVHDKRTWYRVIFNDSATADKLSSLRAQLKFCVRQCSAK